MKPGLLSTESSLGRGVILRARAGDDVAFGRVHQTMLPIVVQEARRRMYLTPLCSLSFDDLCQEGRYGLWRAVGSYRFGALEFETFARFCIRRQIVSAIRAMIAKRNVVLSEAMSLEASRTDDGEANLADVIPAPETTEGLARVLALEQLTEALGRLTSELSSFEAEVTLRIGAGWGVTELATRMGRSAKSVDNALRRSRTKLGIAAPGDATPADDVVRLYASGMTCAEVGHTVGRSDGAVRKLLNDLGVSRRRRGTRAIGERPEERAA